MVVTFLGISFLIQSILHGLGFSYMVSRKIRNAEFRLQFQGSLVLPYMILGIGWTILGITQPTFHEQNSFGFCIQLIAIAIIPLILVIRNKKKYLGLI